MNSRERILNLVRQNKPALLPLPELEAFPQAETNHLERFSAVLRSIGGEIYQVANAAEARQHLRERFPLNNTHRVIDFATDAPLPTDGHAFEDVFVAVLCGQFGVAENGAIWFSEQNFPGQLRVLPFICEHLVAFLTETAIVPTMYEAYERLGGKDYGGYGVFIAGPSKTADIEQSLVIGAHGPRSLTLYLLPE